MAQSSWHGDFLRCRTLGHAWMDIDADRIGKIGGDPFWLRCERCGTERHDSVSFVTGDLMGRNYVYPDAYQHAFDDSFEVSPTRADFRRMLLTDRIEHNRKQRAMHQEALKAAEEAVEQGKAG